MRMFNPDGTEDECGNGLRCLALFAHQRGLVTDKDFRIEALSGIKQATVGALVDGSAAVTVDRVSCTGWFDLALASLMLFAPCLWC